METKEHLCTRELLAAMDLTVEAASPQGSASVCLGALGQAVGSGAGSSGCLSRAFCSSLCENAHSLNPLGWRGPRGGFVIK